MAVDKPSWKRAFRVWMQNFYAIIFLNYLIYHTEMVMDDCHQQIGKVFSLTLKKCDFNFYGLSVRCCRKSIPKFFYKLYQHLRDKDDENDEEDDGHWNLDRTKRLNNNLQEMDGITGEHARVIEESDIITTFLNKNGKRM